MDSSYTDFLDLAKESEPPKDDILSRTVFTVAEKPGHSNEAACRR